jgi:hypothetical protein
MAQLSDKEKEQILAKVIPGFRWGQTIPRNHFFYGAILENPTALPEEMDVKGIHQLFTTPLLVNDIERYGTIIKTADSVEHTGKKYVSLRLRGVITVVSNFTLHGVNFRLRQVGSDVPIFRQSGIYYCFPMDSF